MGAAEVDARIRFQGSLKLEPDARAFARIRVSKPITCEPGDRFVIREAGRRTTIAGGCVLDVQPRRKSGDAAARLSSRAAAARDDLPELVVKERGAVRADESFMLTGSRAHGAALEIGDWLVDPELRSPGNGTPGHRAACVLVGD